MELVSEKKQDDERTVVFYDGDCGMCNAVVMKLLDWDERGLFFYAPLQGSYASEVLPEKFTEDLSTMVLFSDGKNFTKSSAMIEILRLVRKFPFLRFCLSCVPRVLRDIGYSVVAKCRHIFGKPSSCRILNDDEKSKFLS